MSKSPILRKITLTILTVSLGGVLILGLVLHLTINRQFQAYLDRNELARQQQVTQALTQFYQENGGWPSYPMKVRFNLMSNLEYVTDRHERLVMIGGRGRRMNPEAGQGGDSSRLVARPILVNGTRVGTAYFGTNPLQELFSRQDQLFRSAINRSIFWSILIMAAVSIGVAVNFAKRLSKPIMAMNRIAGDMAAGNLDTRISSLSRDELGELGKSLNQLAERLKEGNELRKKMTANVAHDLRTPLATIKSHLEGMIDAVIPPSKENLESLHEEVDRLTLLVNDLQTIAAADVTIQRMTLAPMKLDVFLKDLVTRMTPLFRAKGVVLELEPMPPLPFTTNAEALAKILDNLLTNAYKFTPAGKNVTLSVAKDEKTVAIAVSDQGIGIAPADLPYIFERFYRADPSRNRENGGFGLGLTIARDLAKALGGTITVSSHPGEGSVFTLRLPLVSGQNAPFDDNPLTPANIVQPD